MLETGVITRVDQPTDWCTPTVVTPKSVGNFRVCVDLNKLNDYVKRENHHFQQQTQLSEDWQALESGFWQIKLAWESRPLTTFITPWANFAYTTHSKAEAWGRWSARRMGIKATDNIHHSLGPFRLQLVALWGQFWFQEISEEYESDPPGIRWRGVQQQ